MENTSLFNENKTLQSSFSSENEVPYHFWKKGTVGRHSHEYFEIFLITEGRVTHEFNGENAVLTQGTLGLIQPGQVHSFSPFAGENTVHFNAKLSPTLFKFLCEGVHHNLYAALSARKQLPTCVLKPHEYEYFLQKTEQLSCVNADEASAIVRAMIFNFLSYLYAAISVEQPPYPQWFADFLETLNHPENFTKPLSELYGKSTYSQTRLNAYFHKYLQTTIVEYFTKRKLNYACNLLRSTDYTVAQIAYSSGFNNLSNFNAVFKRVLGEPPTAYRKRFFLFHH